jgi:hypothetical protein
MKGSSAVTDSPTSIANARLRATLLMEDYSKLTEDSAARLLFAEVIADLLIEAEHLGQDHVVVVQRALRIMGRDFAVSGAPRGQRSERVPEPPEHAPDVPAPEGDWQEPPVAARHEDDPKWEEPPVLGTRKRGRMGKWELAMRAQPGRFLVFAENVTSSYAAQMEKQHPDFEFLTAKQRRNDKRSYKVWARCRTDIQPAQASGS